MISTQLLEQILRYLLYVEIVGTVIVLILTAVLASAFNSGGYDSIPGKLGWNIAVAVLTLVAFIAMTTTRRYKKELWDKMILPRYSWPRLAVHGTFFVFWLVASATAFWDCDDLCGATSGDWAAGFGLFCTCEVNLRKRITVPKYRAGKGGRHGQYSTYQAAQAFDLILMFCFLASSILIFLIWHLNNRTPEDQTEVQAQSVEAEKTVDPVVNEQAQPSNPQEIPRNSHQQDLPRGANAYDGV